MTNFIGDGFGSGLGGGLGMGSAAALAWLMFEKSGDIGHYMLYSRLKENDGME